MGVSDVQMVLWVEKLQKCIIREEGLKETWIRNLVSEENLKKK